MQRYNLAMTTVCQQVFKFKVFDKKSFEALDYIL